MWERKITIIMLNTEKIVAKLCFIKPRDQYQSEGGRPEGRLGSMVVTAFNFTMFLYIHNIFNMTILRAFK